MRDSHAAIVLIEGDALTSELYARELSRDFTVLACAEVERAPALVQTQAPVAVVIEPALAGGQGWRLLAVLGGICAERGIPIIVCSTLDERRRGLNLGAAAYLVKPTLPTVLHATVLDVLRQNAAAQRFFRA